MKPVDQRKNARTSLGDLVSACSSLLDLSTCTVDPLSSAPSPAVPDAGVNFADHDLIHPHTVTVSAPSKSRGRPPGRGGSNLVGCERRKADAERKRLAYASKYAPQVLCLDIDCSSE